MILSFLIWILVLPLQIFLLIAALLAEFISLSLGVFRKPFALTGVTSKKCSIVILNWNGRDLLQDCLPAVIQAVERDGRNHEVLVVDNGSSDDSMEWTRRHFPHVETLELDENLGFGDGNNRGVAAASNEIVVLLNNDTIVSSDFLTPLLEPFGDPDIFAVSSQVFLPPGKQREETGNTCGRFVKGYFHLSHEPIRKHHITRRFLPILWAGGGSSAFRRDYFLKLGGFSSIFSPCYVEDTDLSYRAWRRGLRVLFAVDSRVLHKHRSTTRRRFHEIEVRAMVEQRKLWYLWKNFELRTLLSHFLLYPLAIPHRISPGGYLKALAKAPRALLLRAREPHRVYKDTRFLEWIRRPLNYLNHFQSLRHLLGERSVCRVLIASAYLPHLGRHGGAGRVFQFFTRLSDRCRFTLVSFAEGKGELQTVDQLDLHCERVETVLRKEFEPVSPYPYEPFEEFNCANFRESLEKVLTEQDFDVVHFEWTQMAQYAHLAPHIPKLVTEVEVNWAAHYGRVALERNPFRRIRHYYNTLQTLNRELQLCRKMEGVICVTDSDANFLDGYLPRERLHVLNTGVDTRYFRPAPSHRLAADSLVYVGAFRHEPNVDAMLYFYKAVFPRILETRPKTHLYIVGSSPPAVIRNLGDHPNVTVTGFVEDIREYYDRAQVVIVPLRMGVGIRGKILEGWASGKAMVATSLACLGIRAIHGENILIADDPEEFSLWVVALLKCPEHCLRLGQAGRKTAVRYYEWDRLALQLEMLYKATVQSGKSCNT